MKENPDTTRREPGENEPASAPLGVMPPPVARAIEDGPIHIGPEFAVGEGDIRSTEDERILAGASLWRDAWRRLLRNKLAVFGMIVVSLIIVASLFGPFIIRKTTGYSTTPFLQVGT